MAPQLLNMFTPTTHLFVFFGLPAYYAGQAAPVLRAMPPNRSDLRDTDTPAAHAVQEDGSVIIIQPDAVHLNTNGSSPCEMFSGRALAQLMFSDNPTGNIGAAWKDFIAQCQMEWLGISGLAFTFITSSPAALQAFHDPLTRSFLYLAIFQAVWSIGFSMTHLVWFRSPETRTAHFARVWFQGVDKERNSAISAQWIMFSLPAVALCWGAIAFFIALISSVWHGSTPTITGLPQTIGLVPKLIITALCLMGFVCVIWISAAFKTAIRITSVRAQRPY